MRSPGTAEGWALTPMARALRTRSSVSQGICPPRNFIVFCAKRVAPYLDGRGRLQPSSLAKLRKHSSCELFGNPVRLIPMRIAFYARVSTTDQNCEMQLRELREYAAVRKRKACAEYVDTGWSGGKTKLPE